jgi:hypothetical protein
VLLRQVELAPLCVELNALEEQVDNAKARDLYWKPLSWLGTIRPTSANDAFDPALLTTFASTTPGLEFRVLSSLSRRLHSHVYSSLRCNQGARHTLTK